MNLVDPGGDTLLFCCRAVVDQAAKILRNAAGNYYVNDKSTGSIVAQQPFGGARASGERCYLLSSHPGCPQAGSD